MPDRSNRRLMINEGPEASPHYKSILVGRVIDGFIVSTGSKGPKCVSSTYSVNEYGVGDWQSVKAVKDLNEAEVRKQAGSRRSWLIVCCTFILGFTPKTGERRALGRTP